MFQLPANKIGFENLRIVRAPFSKSNKRCLTQIPDLPGSHFPIPAKKHVFKEKHNKKHKVLPKEKTEKPKKEIGGQEGPEPTRYGDWEKKGITSDF